MEREVDATQSHTPVDEHLLERRDREAVKAKLEAALAAINPRYATAIRLRILEEKPREEVATIMKVSPATFDVLLHRAVAALKKRMTEGKEDGDV